LDTADLLRFLRDAHRRGYAAGQDALTVREADHSSTIVFESGEWRFHDNYFGGEPFGGRAVAFLGGRPVWMAVYYGRVDDPGPDVQSIYSFLQRALRLAPDDFPFRGPDELIDDAFQYRNIRRGDIADFSGEELIDYRGRPVYIARYSGGLVDRRRGD
jgi:Domain of unknown function (DUF5680)